MGTFSLTLQVTKWVDMEAIFGSNLCDTV